MGAMQKYKTIEVRAKRFHRGNVSSKPILTTEMKGKVISIGRAGKFASEGLAEADTMVKEFQREGIWSREKEQLLKTHPGWFVAYQDERRVALEPSLDRLVVAMDEKLGSPRKPCKLHEIIEQPTVKRGPSPRFWPVHSKQ